MCEYCGCKALENTDELTQAHERVVTLISRVCDARRDGAITRMAELAREITAVLGPRNQVKEHGWSPSTAAKSPEQIDGLQAEHRRIESALAEADGPFLTDPGWPDRLIAALDLLREHIIGVVPAALATRGTDEGN